MNVTDRIETDDSSGYTEDTECVRYFTEGGPSDCTVYEITHWK